MTTINDIARIAEVSKATVSKVINNYPGVNDDTKKKVIKIMKKNNYWPNSIARSLSTNKSYTIGIFDPTNLNNFFFREVFWGVESYLGRKGYDIVYFTNKNWQDSWVNFSFKEKCQNRNVDGALMMGYGRVEPEQFESLMDSDIPSVFVDIDMVGPKASYVTSDNFDGAKKAIEYLYNLGHRRVGMIKGPPGFKVDNDRFIGFQSTLQRLGMEYNPDWIIGGQYEMKTGYDAMKKILKLDHRPTALFTEDIIAIGVIRAIEEAGMSVPEDFSIIGFDNIDLAYHYQLTTISQDQVGLGESAARLLLNIIDNKNFSPVVLPVRLIERKTCRSIKTKG